MSYEIAAQNRQTILDYLHKHGRRGATELVNEIGTMTKNQVQAALVMMTRLDEVAKIGKGQGTRYTAAVKQTTSPEKIQEAIKAARAEKDGFRVKPKESKPGHYVHNPWAVDHMPIPNQEGQGSGRSRVWVGSTAGMI